MTNWRNATFTVEHVCCSVQYSHVLSVDKTCTVCSNWRSAKPVTKSISHVPHPRDQNSALRSTQPTQP